MVLLAMATRSPELARRFLAESAALNDWDLMGRLNKRLNDQFPDGLSDEVSASQKEFAEVSKSWMTQDGDVVRRWQHRIAQFSFEETLPE